jgi:hypothetical protein
LERELKAIESSSFTKAEMMTQMLALIKKDRENTLSEIQTFMLDSQSSCYGRQIKYLQELGARVKG